jgi:hypothetical protein
MSCWHGCAPCRGPYWHGWHAEPMWELPAYDEEEWVSPRRPRRRRGQIDRASAAQALGERLADLRAELERVEAALADLGQPEGAASST